MAMMADTTNNFTNSNDSNFNTSNELAPNTFLMLISFERLFATNETKPNNPKHAMQMAMMEKVLNT